jgi:DNA-binding transcriptional regulator YiaG
MQHKAMRYEGCGLPNIFLLNGFSTKQTPYGPTISINDVEGLHSAIANSLVEKQGVLSGAEFRFLRRFLDCSQKACGAFFNVDAQTIANWEKNNTVDRMADALLRSMVRQGLGGDIKIRQLIEKINEKERVEKLFFLPTRSGWKRQRAANE